MGRFQNLLEEIHRRSLWQVLGIYAAGGWVVLEVVATFVEQLSLPGWVFPGTLLLLAAGLPIVLLTAFVQKGLGTRPAEATGRLGRWLTWRNAALGGLTAFAIWGVVAAGWMLLGGVRERDAPAVSHGSEAPAVAVLPFENRSAAEEDAAFFADGLHDEILTLLSKVGLRVMSRTSVMEYRGANRNITEIADELGADYVVEGGVQRAGERVRINIQLIDGETDEHRWAHTYSDSFTVANIFAIQADIARQIADAVETELTPDDYEAYLTPSTHSEEAYEEFLRGIAALGRGRFVVSDGEEAHQHLERALELDPDFAPARVALANMKVQLHYLGTDRSGALLTEAKRMLDRVIAEHPNLPVAYHALGMYHYQRGDYAQALEAWRRHHELEPQNAGLDNRLADVYRRQGLLEEALTHRLRGLEAVPGSPNEHLNLALTYHLLRRHEEARAAARRTLELDPTSPYALVFLARAALELEGPAAARSALQEAPAEIAQHPQLVLLRTWLDQWAGDHRNALRRTELLDIVVPSGQVVLPGGLWRARSHMALGDTAAGRAELTRTAERLEAILAEHPDDHAALGAVGTVYAALGREAEAIAAAERAVELMPVEKDAVIGPVRLEELALVYAWTGHADDAVERLERLLAIPGGLTRTWLANDPRWDPLRGHSRFEALLERE